MSVSDSAQQSAWLPLDEYALSLEASNRSPKTISWYSDILRRYFGHLREQGLSKPASELGREELRAFIHTRQNAVRWPNNPNISAEKRSKLSAYTVQGDVRAIKAFWSWLESEGYIDVNPLKGFPLPKVPEKQVPGV
jgi:site-specific recombinase XerD